MKDDQAWCSAQQLDATVRTERSSHFGLPGKNADFQYFSEFVESWEQK